MIFLIFIYGSIEPKNSILLTLGSTLKRLSIKMCLKHMCVQKPRKPLVQNLRLLTKDINRLSSKTTFHPIAFSQQSEILDLELGYFLKSSISFLGSIDPHTDFNHPETQYLLESSQTQFSPPFFLAAGLFYYYFLLNNSKSTKPFLKKELAIQINLPFYPVKEKKCIVALKMYQTPACSHNTTFNH